MIEGILQLVDEVKKTTSLTNHQVCLSLGVPYANVLRWQQRHQSGRSVVNQPGPQKTEPLDLDRLQADLAELAHGRHRTAGTSTLHAEYVSAVSRRDFQEQVQLARREQQQAQRASMRRIIWHTPGIVWATDDFEYGRNEMGEKDYVHQLRDAASQYLLPPLAGEFASSEAVAGHWDCQFNRFGAPLFIKRDNAGNLDNPTVNEVLSHHGVLPLNNPPDYPQYNGGMEHAQGEVRQAMQDRLRYKTTPPGEHLEVYAADAVNDWNHRTRRSLSGRTACAVFSDHRKRFTKKERGDIYDCITMETQRILAELHDYSQRAIKSAWRIAVESFLQWKGFITITINGKVLPSFTPIYLH